MLLIVQKLCILIIARYCLKIKHDLFGVLQCINLSWKRSLDKKLERALFQNRIKAGNQYSVINKKFKIIVLQFCNKQRHLW